jgi:hypothetical protein
MIVSMGGVGLAVTASPAAAGVCVAVRVVDDWAGRYGAKSSCPQGTYSWQHRAVVRCSNSGTYYGPWKGGTSSSTALCPGGANVRSWSVQEGPQRG